MSTQSEATPKILHQIIALAHDPDGLENLYQEDKRAFRFALRQALEEQPDVILLQGWRARLEYAQTHTPRLSMPALCVMVLCGLLAGSVLKIPTWFPSTSENDFFPRMLVAGPFAAMLSYTLFMRGWPAKPSILSLGVTVVGTAYLWLIPYHWSDSFALACINFPLLLVSVYAAARMQNDWKDPVSRVKYIRFLGECSLHAGLLFIGGGVLLGLTIGLFDLLHMSTIWVWDYVAVYGLASIPLVAAWATDTYSAARRLVPLMARIFTPLLLILIVTYMGAMLVNLQELFTDRGTLLIYNILLLSVLACAAFTLTGRGEQPESAPMGMVERVTFAMLAASLLLDLVGLYAIGWRIATLGGFTANRLSVIGSNIVTLGHLAILCKGYLNVWQGKATLQTVEHALVFYLPVYTAWTAFSVFFLPWIFRY